MKTFTTHVKSILFVSILITLLSSPARGNAETDIALNRRIVYSGETFISVMKREKVLSADWKLIKSYNTHIHDFAKLYPGDIIFIPEALRKIASVKGKNILSLEMIQKPVLVNQELHSSLEKTKSNLLITSDTLNQLRNDFAGLQSEKDFTDASLLFFQILSLLLTVALLGSLAVNVYLYRFKRLFQQFYSEITDEMETFQKHFAEYIHELPKSAEMRLELMLVFAKNTLKSFRESVSFSETVCPKISTIAKVSMIQFTLSASILEKMQNVFKTKSTLNDFLSKISESFQDPTTDTYMDVSEYPTDGLYGDSEKLVSAHYEAYKQQKGIKQISSSQNNNQVPSSELALVS